LELSPLMFILSSSRLFATIRAMFRTQDLRVKEIVRLIEPAALKAALPITDAGEATVFHSREAVKKILHQKDARLLVIVGPCSIHDERGALEYAAKLNVLRKELAGQMEIVMRVYFEKPRTTVGWKGLINDPHLDNSQDIESGLKIARRLLLDITGMGLPAGTEFLDPIIPQYIADLITWSAIGARTTESQTHRELASGLSMPVGFKNATDGSLQIAIDAMTSARTSHSFLGIDQDGFTSIVRTTGNNDGHIVLRGGRLQTNYDAKSIQEAESKLAQAKLPEVLMVDCSHANSGKQPARQEDVWRSIIEQRGGGTKSLAGAMIESYLQEGSQPIPKKVSELRYGISITDACISWEATERMLRWGHEQLAKVPRELVAV
jgi:3-deoxy-7-phosphoheptulonate synthase